MECKVCGFKETDDKKMVGIFSAGSSFMNTNDNIVGLYGCPQCKTVIWTDDNDYINKRKEEWKSSRRNKN